MNEARFKDDKGRELFVDDGISRGEFWFTVYRKPTGSKKRVVSKNLPLRRDRGEAQRDLEALATKRGWVRQ